MFLMHLDGQHGRTIGGVFALEGDVLSTTLSFVPLGHFEYWTRWPLVKVCHHGDGVVTVG